MERTSFYAKINLKAEEVGIWEGMSNDDRNNFILTLSNYYYII